MVAWIKVVSDGDEKKWSNSGSILKIKPTRFVEKNGCDEVLEKQRNQYPSIDEWIEKM